MRTIPLPGVARPVSALCYGAGSLGTGLFGSDAERQIALFLEAGGDFFDTAHCYACWVPGGSGASERELGRALRALGALDRVTVATKGGHPSFGEHYVRPDDFLSEKVLERDIDESLERLGVAAIDLYYLHRDDGVTPVDEVMERLAAQVRRGRLKALGASNWSIERLAAANAYADARGLPSFVASEIQGSLAVPTWRPTNDPTVRFADDATWRWHADAGVPLVLYSATASGYFAGNAGANGLYDSPGNQARRERARALAERHGATPTQIALAYLLSQPAPAIALFGTSNEAHLREILAAEARTLTADECAWLAEG